MSTPSFYRPQFDFTSYQTSHPSDPLPGNSVDNELFNIASSIAQIIQNLNIIQRADTALATGSVGYDQLAVELDIGVNTVTTWLTATAYVPRSYVMAPDGNLYRCAIAHTSGVFATDLAAAKWQLVINFTAFLTAQIPNLIQTVSFRNAFINGTGQIVQRGTSFANIQNAVTQAMDGWIAYRAANVNGITVSQVAGAATADGTFYKNLVRTQRTAADTSTNLTTTGLLIPSKDMPRYAGKTVTLSFVARAGANFTTFNGGIGANLIVGTGTDQGSDSLRTSSWTGQVAIGGPSTQPLTTTLTRFSYTFGIPANATEAALLFQNFNLGTAGANDYFDVGGVQLELGSTATPYEDLCFEDELHRCLPFYCKSFDYATVPAQNSGISANAYAIVSQAANPIGGAVHWPRPMYKAPTVVTYNPSAANANWRDASAGADRTVSVIRVGTRNAQIYTSVNTVAGNENLIHWSAEGGL